MNLSDLNNKATELSNHLDGISGLIKDLFKVNSKFYSFKSLMFSQLVEFNLNIDSTSGFNNVKPTVTQSKEIYNEYLDSIDQIDFVKYSRTIFNLENNYEEFEYNHLVHAFKLVTDSLNEFKKDKCTSRASNVHLNITNFINSYNNLNTRLGQVKRTYNVLQSKNQEDEVFKLRLLSEENSVEFLISNLNLLQSIYDNTSEILGLEPTPLKYARLESGTLEFLFIAGATFSVMQPMFKFAYKVYSEQFSTKAKLANKSAQLDIMLKDIKVRAEYFKFIKASNPDLEVGKNTQANLYNLEVNIQKFFANNPCVIVNNDLIGIKELKERTINVKQLGEPSEIEIPLD